MLLLLDGTVPVAFRGTKYGFPVAIWVPHAYPREPPIVYVTPSQDTIVRPGQHVSGDGRIYHPYLAQWGQYWDVSTHKFSKPRESVSLIWNVSAEVDNIRFPSCSQGRFRKRATRPLKTTAGATRTPSVTAPSSSTIGLETTC